MTEYLEASSSSPSLAETLGSSLGQALGGGFQQYAKTKLDTLLSQAKQTQERAKGKGELPILINKFAKFPGRESYNIDDFKGVQRLAEKYFDGGMTKEESVDRAYQDYENPDFVDPDASPLEMLSKEKRNMDKIPLHERTQAKGKTFWDLWKPRELTSTPEGKVLSESIQKKIKTAKSLDEFTMSELVELTPQDVAQLPVEAQEQFKKIAPDLRNRSEMIAKTAITPFAGGAIEERFREKMLPGTPGPPPIVSGMRIAGELPLLSAALGGETASLLEKGIRGAAVFGGDAAVEEAIRTLGTDKPVDLSKIGIQTLVGGMFPFAESLTKTISSSLRNVIAKTMKFKKMKNVSAAIDDIFNKAKKEGILFEELEKGSEKEAEKFNEFLRKESKSPSEAPKAEPGGSPKAEPVKAEETILKEAENITQKPDVEGLKRTSEKIEKIPFYRSETGKEAEKRFASEAKALSQSPLEIYFEPEKIKKTGYEQRKSLLQPRILKNEARIAELEKEVLRKTGSELQEARKELSSLRENNRKLSSQIKYDKLPPTDAELKKSVEDSIHTLFNDILNPSAEGAKRISTNTKMMDTFLKKAKDELVKGKLPEKFAEDTFLNINKEYLKGYKKLKNEIESLLKDETSTLYKSKEGPAILENLEKRIKGIEAALQTQEQKRKALRSLKGPTGKFYRKNIDDLRKTNHLFSKDSIRIGEKIAESEKNVSNIVKERLEKTGGKAFVEGEKTFTEAAEKAGFTEAESKEMYDSAKKIKEAISPTSSKSTSGKLRPNDPSLRFGSLEGWRKWINPRVNKLLTPIKNQVMAGFVLGTIDSIVKETTGKKPPSPLKNGIYALSGFTGKRGSKKPFLSMAAWITDLTWNVVRKSYHKSRLEGKRGIERRKEYEKIKKKGFTQKELKEIRSAR